MDRSHPRSNHPEVVEMRRYMQAGNSIICKCLHTSVGDMFQTLRARLIAICVAITVFSLLTLALATFFMVRKDTLTQLDFRVGR